jgi:hypothetical protein
METLCTTIIACQAYQEADRQAIIARNSVNLPGPNDINTTKASRAAYGDMMAGAAEFAGEAVPALDDRCTECILGKMAIRKYF